MKGRFTIIHYQEYNIGNHLCTNKVMLGISFLFFKSIMRLHFFAFKTETDRGLWLK